MEDAPTAAAAAEPSDRRLFSSCPELSAAAGVAGHGQPPFLAGSRWLAGLGAPRYSLAMRALSRAVRLRRDPAGGRTAPSTYDLTK